MTLRLDPHEVDTAADGWDDQHLALTGAAGGLRSASAAGFTAAVQGPARRFASAWTRITADLAAAAESRADSMRASAVVIVDADVDSVVLAAVLRAELEEVR